MEDNLPTRDIIAENQTAAAISKLRRGEADDALRDEVQAATLSTMQKMLEELAGLKSGMWSKNDLKTLIDEEQSIVLSDDAIGDILRKKGMDIARRTVAKYREALRIPSSVQRRRLKQLAGG